MAGLGGFTGLIRNLLGLDDDNKLASKYGNMAQ